jgi:hypothetical protein
MKQTEIDKALIFLNELKQKKTEKILYRREQNIRDKEKQSNRCAEWGKRNKNKRDRYQRKAILKKLYGISPQQYLDRFETQNGCCAICGIHQDSLKTKLNVDHDHKTKEVRGLLCVKCNFALGYLNENIEIVYNLLNYLNKYKK